MIALGGNALGSTPQQQLQLVAKTAGTIVDLIQDGFEVVIGHGNGPQVGMINLAMDFSAENGGGTPLMPFPECGAMTQGYIGYHLQQAIQNELTSRGIKKKCATVVTQVVVDRNDSAFQNPTKPVGMFYGREEAAKIAAAKGFAFVEDAGRGYRRVVASPKPVRIVELALVEELVAAGSIVITVGGGGIPVVEEGGLHSGVAAVIDKDRASSLLASNLRADKLVILTAVEKVAINFNKPDQQDLDTITVDEARKYVSEGHFAPGSMLPKIEACLEYLENSDGEALITSLQRASEALKGLTGTRIIK